MPRIRSPSDAEVKQQPRAFALLHQVSAGSRGDGGEALQVRLCMQAGGANAKARAAATSSADRRRRPTDDSTALTTPRAHMQADPQLLQEFVKLYGQPTAQVPDGGEWCTHVARGFVSLDPRRARWG